MNKFKHFIGIDLSKEVFDAAILINGSQKTEHQQFENSKKGCNTFFKWLKSFKIELVDCLVCCEHTGIYINLIADFLLDKQIALWVEMSYRIIRSSGIQRGKSDKIDSQRIAYYAFKHQENTVLYEPKSKTIVQIKALMNLRDKLVKHKQSLRKVSNELIAYDKETAKLIEKHQRKTLCAIEKDITEIESKIDELIKSDQNIKEKVKQICSVPGVGKITAIMLICFTNEFKNFEKPRQLACYCGVVPFEYTSGKSIKGRPRVHFMANKQLKKLLHMCALVSIQHEPDLRTYYERKTAEGKSLNSTNKRNFQER